MSNLPPPPQHPYWTNGASPTPPPKEGLSKAAWSIFACCAAFILLVIGAAIGNVEKAEQATGPNETSDPTLAVEVPETTTTTAAPTTTIDTRVELMDYVKITMCSEHGACGTDADIEELVGYACDTLDDIDPTRTMSEDDVIEDASTLIWLMSDGDEETDLAMSSLLGMVYGARSDLCP